MDFRDLAVGIGIALALEGVLWGAAPGAMRRAVRALEASPDMALRLSALVALAIGVGIVWAARVVGA
jgi:uncharacterized protein YjeT (DUF2065 family)